MVDIKKIRNNFEFYKKKILSKDPSFNFDLLIDLDKLLLEKKIILDDLYHKVNIISKNFSGNISEEKKLESKDLNKKIEYEKNIYNSLEKQFEEIYLRCPNIPNEDLPVGNKSENKVIKIYGEKPKFNFLPKSHLELLSKDKKIDFEAGAKIAGSGFVVYSDEIVWIMYKLCMLFLRHNKSFGFKTVIPPYLISEKGLTAASNLPRFQEDVFHIEKDNLFLIPTAEVGIAYLHENFVLSEEELPIRYSAWTGCFRREAGGYGANEKGLIRLHEFQKVEIFSFTTPEKSFEEHEYMLSCAESILNKIGLHYQVSLLSTEDCSFASVKTYDIEVWLAGQNQYREISSISNCTDFQARRSKTRFYNLKNKKNELVHTLNGSCFAIPRLLVALIEKYQTEDGKIDFKEIFNIINEVEKSF